MIFIVFKSSNKTKTRNANWRRNNVSDSVTPWWILWNTGTNHSSSADAANHIGATHHSHTDSNHDGICDSCGNDTGDGSAGGGDSGGGSGD